MGQHSFSPALALNITDVEKFEVENNWPGGEKIDWLFFSPGEKND